MSTTIPIQDLDTTTNPPAGRTIHAVVTLVWPYSSSTRQCAILLSELDFRLRAKGGQVRVKFSGPSARAVAEQKLGIGDQVTLGLKGGDWVRDEGGIAVRIPGKSVGELQFGRGLQLRVQKDGVADAEINVSEDAMDDVEEETRQMPKTPAAKKRSSGTGFRSSVGSPPASAAIYSSPAFVKRMAEFSYLDGLSRLFEEELDDQNGPRKKARISIGDVKDWKVVDRTPSPEVPTAGPDTGDSLEVTHEDLQAGSDENEPVQISSVERSIKDTSTAVLSSERVDTTEPLRSAQKGSTGSVPLLQVPTASPAAQPNGPTFAAEDSMNPSTPRLLPVASTALPSTTPQISPLTAKNIVGEPSEIGGARLAEDRPQEATSTQATVEQRGLPAAPQLQNAPEVVVEDDSATNASESLLDPARSDVFVDQADHEADDMADELPLAMDTPAVQSNIPDNELDENMSDVEGEDDEMFMNEEDAEDVFDADALEGEEPSDDDTNEDLEMNTMTGEGQEFIQSSVEDSDIESELEDAQAAHDQLDDEIDHQPGQAIADEAASQQPVFKPASMLLQGTQTPLKQTVGSDINKGAPGTTPATKSLQFLNSEQPATVATPAAKSADTPKRTPQSAHDRVMKRTLQSLFGLKGTPSPEKEDRAAPKSSVEAEADQQAVTTAQDVAEDPRSLHDEPQIETAEESQEGADDKPEASSQKAQEGPVEVIELASSSDEEEEAPLPADEMAETDHNVVSEPTSSAPMPQQRKAPAKSAPVHGTLQEMAEEPTSEAASIAQLPVELEDLQPVVGPRSQEVEMEDSREHQQVSSPEDDAAVGTPEHDMVEAEGKSSVPESSGTEAPLAEFMEVEESRPAETEVPDLEASTQMQITEQEVQSDEPELFQPAWPAEATKLLPAEGEPEQSIAHGTTTETSEVQQREVISSPTSFQSQLAAEARFDPTQRQQGLETSSRPGSRDAMEGFSPVALGSVSRKVLDTNGEHGAEDLVPGSIATHEVGQASVHTPAYERVATEADGLIPDETKQTPSRATKQTEVIELDSSPSETLSPVKIKQSVQMEELTPQQSSFEDKQETFVREELVQRDEQTTTEVPLEHSHRVQTNEQGTAVDVQATSHLDLPPTPSLSQPVKAETLLPQANVAEAAAQHVPITPQASSKPQPSSQLPFSGLKEYSAMDTETAKPQEDQEAQSTQPAQQRQPKTPARRSLRTRLSNVPDVISAWFSPKRSSIVAAQEASKEQEHSLEEPPARAPEPEATDIKPTPPPVEGLSTPHAYFTPLSTLPQHLNPSSPQTIDILAVVTTAPKAPERAKAGPRDYFTSFRVAETSLPLQPPSSVRVEVFRPWKAVLPAAEAGDVVLLRAFAVRSRKRRAFLLSCDASAWCVWRFGEVAEEEGKKRKRRSSVSGVEVREEVKGPPVEFGEAERERARVLRAWWVAVRGEEGGGGVVEGEEENRREVGEDEDEEA